MKQTSESRTLQSDALEVGLAALVGVVVVAVFFHGKRGPIVGAIAIGVVIALAELALAQSRRRIDDLRRTSRELALANRELAERVGASGAELPPGAPPDGEHVGPSGDHPTRPTPAVDTAAVPVPLRQFIASDPRPDDIQCPSCGRFQVDAQQAATYRCRACGSVWKWQRGAWPDVKVLPDLRQFLPGPATPS